MTNPDGPNANDKAPSNGTAADAAGPEPTRAPQSNAPSWVDEVLGAGPDAPRPPTDAPGSSRPNLTKTPAANGDLRIPDSARPAAAHPAEPLPAPRPPRPDGWATGATASDATRPGVNPGAPAGGFDAWGDPQRQPVRPPVPAAGDFGDVAQKRLIAGLLAIVLGSLGVHKFYLGLNTAGAVTLGVNVGVWILALLLGLITLGIGLIITVPLAGLVSAGLGLIEGVLYLTKSDADFQREYLVGKKPWL